MSSNYSLEAYLFGNIQLIQAKCSEYFDIARDFRTVFFLIRKFSEENSLAFSANLTAMFQTNLLVYQNAFALLSISRMRVICPMKLNLNYQLAD